MKKICIVIPYDYPVPIVRGGAIETLVQFLVDENEKTPHYEFTVLCTYDPSAEQSTHKYQYTKFVFSKKSDASILFGCLCIVVLKKFSTCTFRFQYDIF